MKPQPSSFYIPLSRRKLLSGLVLASAGLMTRGAFAEALTLTPRMTEGPYYPDKLPLDQDNDLIRVNDHVTPAIGIITNLHGRILGSDGKPISNALIELWQADDHGTYIHTRGAERATRDPDFQGYGKFETASDGGYRFRTIKPGLYTGRTRHYHFGITLPGKRRFTTQLFFSDEPGNARDGVLNGIKNEAQKKSVIRDFVKMEGSQELATEWDIVMGLTPQEEEHDEHDDHMAPPPRGAGGPPRGEQGGRPRPGQDGPPRE